MQYFGDARYFPEGSKRIPVPVDERCSFCTEPIDSGDSGYVIPGIESVESPRLVWEPWHLECFLRQLLGPVGHQKGTCSCYGGAEGDPPGMTRREAAKAAMAEHRRKTGAR